MNDNRIPRHGATLYVPALHHTVADVRSGSVDDLASMVICLEDAIRDDQVPQALDSLERHLDSFVPGERDVVTYVRPRTPWMAQQVMRMKGARDLRGFVIPKATPESLGDWVSILRGEGWAVMPTIETVHAFDVREVHRLRDQAVALGVDVDVVRIGGNDILSTIGARRSSKRTLYDGPLGPVVLGIVGAFAGTGIPLSSPVLEHYSDERLLIEEIERDMEHGIHNKTAIHPRQVSVISATMRPTAAEVEEARLILSDGAQAVFGKAGSMCEPQTHSTWARMVLDRYRHLGVREQETPASRAS